MKYFEEFRSSVSQRSAPTNLTVVVYLKVTKADQRGPRHQP